MTFFPHLERKSSSKQDPRCTIIFFYSDAEDKSQNRTNDDDLSIGSTIHTVATSWLSLSRFEKGSVLLDEGDGYCTVGNTISLIFRPDNVVIPEMFVVVPFFTFNHHMGLFGSNDGHSPLSRWYERLFYLSTVCIIVDRCLTWRNGISNLTTFYRIPT